MKITRENLKNIVREAMVEESAYQEFFKKALEKTGKSIPQMSDDEKKAFFNKIDSAWKGKGEKKESVDEIEEEAVVVSKRTPSGNIVSKLKEESVNEGTKPKFKVGDMVKYKGAKISAKVLKVIPTNWENGYLIQFQDTKKKEEAGESSLVSESVNEGKADPKNFRKGFRKGDDIINDNNPEYVIVNNNGSHYIVEPARSGNGRRQKINLGSGMRYGRPESGNLSLSDIQNESVNEESINELDTKKADMIRKSMPGFVGPEFAKKASDEDILAMADLKDQHAKIYNTYMKSINDKISKLQKKYRIKESTNEESINEGTDIYLNKRIQITKFAGQNGQMVQINAPKYQTAGDHIAMSKDEFIRMLKNSSKILNQLKESNESVNEAATDRDFEKVYSIFDKKDYFGIKGSIKTMLGNWQRALDKGDKGAQQYSKEDIIKNVTDTTKARAKHTYDELVNAINKKDIKSLKSKLRHDQPFSLTVFAQVTGKKLPKSTRDIHSFLDNEFMNESVNERIGSDKGEVGNANFKNRLAALKKSQGINKGDKVVVNYPTLIKPLKGIVAQILKSTNGNVYVLKGGNGVWDEKYVTKQ
jgi:hypothetical protein